MVGVPSRIQKTLNLLLVIDIFIAGVYMISLMFTVMNDCDPISFAASFFSFFLGLTWAITLSVTLAASATFRRCALTIYV